MKIYKHYFVFLYLVLNLSGGRLVIIKAIAGIETSRFLRSDFLVFDFNP